MTARMPIAAGLLAGRPCAYAGAVLDQVMRERPEDVRSGADLPVVVTKPVQPVVQQTVLRTLRNSVPFDIQVASELYWGRPKDYYEIDEFTSMRLPHRQVWFEWGIPRTGYRNGKRYNEPNEPVRFAAYLYEEDPDPGKDAHRTMVVQVLADPQQDHPDRADHPNGVRPLLLNEVPIKFDVDERGQYIDGSLVEYRPKDVSPEANEMLVNDAKSAIFTCAMALQLVNCRNITTAKAGCIPVRRSGREKRQGVQPLAFHTIVLPGMTVERGKPNRRAANANAEAMRLHMVRGHFKHFTAEAPLLGRHVGTYWWNPAVRGNAKRGAVVADYKIGTPHA